MDPLRTISRYQKIRLQKLGAAVSGSAVTATEDQLWRAPIVGGQRQLLNKRAQFIADTGGGVPDWVPDNAKIYIDLVNDRAWTEADGEVAIGTLLGADANTENAWNISEYDPDKLTVNGYVPTGRPPALINGALSAVLAGATVVIKSRNSGPTGGDTSLVVMAANGNDAVEVDLNSNATQRYLYVASYAGPLSITSTVASGNYLADGGAINVIAVTITDTRIEVAVNGADLQEGSLSSTDRPTGNPLVAAIVDSPNNALQSITIYDALPSTAGLSALSETGVTNTAPTVITYSNQIQGDGFNQELNTFGAGEYAGGNFFGAEYNATDNEGNPVTLTIVDWDGPGTLRWWSVNLGDYIEGGVPGGVAAIATKNDVDPPVTVAINDVWHYTLRATDPGGLYVEQQFTITVTA